MEEEEKKVIYLNMESIIEAMRVQVTNVISMRKYDGITIECEVSSPELIENGMNEMQALSKKLGLVPVATEARKDSNTLFGVQYPEFKPIYSEDEMKSMYTANFKFVLDNIKMKDPKSITRTKLIENMDRLTKHAITIFCRSNINQYKESVNDYLDNAKYRTKINGWYLEFIDTYLRPSVK